jgi:hypothetical protein
MLENAMQFLNKIGIETRMEVGSHGFLPGVRIVNGTLAVDPRCKASDLLHEAGHVAIMPRRYRHMLNGDILPALIAAWEDAVKIDAHPESPLMRALLQCSDPEATAWAWAAGRHLGLEPEEIIPDSSDPHIYGGEAAGVRLAHELNHSLGAHGLAAAGFCQVGMFNRHNPLPPYPRLAFWTQQA